MKGATSVSVHDISAILSFNPRTREGCDPALAIILHTLNGFNPRTREGCDDLPHKGYPAQNCFNPRTREGCDTAGHVWQNQGICFNPRTREGCDEGRMKSLADIIVSIHAPVKGATIDRKSVV